MSDDARPIDRIRVERKLAAQTRASRCRLTRVAVGTIAGLLLLVGSLGIALSNETGDDVATVLLLGVGDHWHARYTVTLDGEDLGILPASQGDIHSHGDGLVHIHPQSEMTAGDAATLSAFFASLGGELTDEALRLPDGRTFTGSGVEIRVDGEAISGWASYVPQDGDQIEIIITTVNT